MPNNDEITVENEHLSMLSEIYPDIKFKLIKESENELVYLADGEKISIEEIKDKVIIETSDLTIHANFNESASMIKDEALKGDLTSSKPELISIEYYNDNNEIVGFKNLNGTSNVEEGCTSGSVLECVGNHCADAGAILCGGCALSKICMGGLIAWCTAEVQFEIENPIHCDEEL